MASKIAGESHWSTPCYPPKREPRWIVRMTCHSHVIFFGGRNDLFQEVGYALPIVLVAYSAGISSGQTLPVVFQLERIVDSASASRDLPVPAIRGYPPVICSDLHAGLRCLPV